MHSSLKQILVHLDASPRSAARLRTARALARQHGASLAALYAAMPSFLSVPTVPDFGTGALAALSEADAQQREAARAAFDAAIDEGSGPRGSWSDCEEVPLVNTVAEQAMYADLLVLGQHCPDAPAPGVPADFAESVLAASGRPALLLPYAGGPWDEFEAPVIAWTPAPEAARAVQAALPLLQRAGRAHVLCWDGAGEAAAPVRGARLDLGGYLRLHGIEAQWHHEGEEPPLLGEILLSRLDDLRGDLLVMGCYGHSRAREWVLGGTSRTVLGGMTAPVLMAH